MRFLVPHVKQPENRDGSTILGDDLCLALVGAGHEVWYLTHDHALNMGPDIKVVPVPGPRVSHPRLFPPQASGLTIIRDLARMGPERIGLPTGKGAFEAVLALNRDAIRETRYIVDRHYPDALNIIAAQQDPVQLEVVHRTPVWGGVAQNWKNYFPRADVVFGPGPRAAALAMGLAGVRGAETPPSTFEIIPGIDVHAGPVAARPESGFTVLLLGRTDDENKGAEDLLRAVRDLRQDGMGVRLVILGEQSDAAGVAAKQQQVDRFMGERGAVEVHQFTDRAEVINDAIARCHAMVVPSESELYGLVTSEWAGHGKPFLLFEGMGHGFADFLRERFPSGAAHFTVDDRGSRTWRGDVLGGAPHNGRERSGVIAAAIKDVHDHYAERMIQARNLQRLLGSYSWPDAATAFTEVVRRVRENEPGHFRQESRGQVHTLTDDEVKRALAAYAEHVTFTEVDRAAARTALGFPYLGTEARQAELTPFELGRVMSSGDLSRSALPPPLGGRSKPIEL